MKKLNAGILLILAFLFLPVGAYAAEPYRGYNYDSNGAAVSAPNGYEPDSCITGITLGIGSFDSPEDIFVEKETQTVYIVDSGNKRIVMLDKSLNYTGMLKKYYDHGKEVAFGNLTGIYVIPSVGIYLADGDNSRILCIDFEGNLIKTYEKPNSSLYIGTNFMPRKVLVDSALNVYALCTGVYQGAVVFDHTGKFTGYYGSTKVMPTAKIIMERFWKKIMTEEQKSAMQRYVPIEYTGFDIDKNDFIYAVTQTNSLSNNSIRKLNPAGDNILSSDNVFGDYLYYYLNGSPVITRFIDVYVDEDGFIYALDATGGKVFQYDSEGELVFTFGKMGSQLGAFKQPVAVDTLGKSVLVLDKRKKNITSFVSTEFGDYVRKAILLYNEGLYDQAKAPLLEVIKRDSNYEFAYVGLGKAAMNMYQYEEAMKYFKLGKDRDYCSRAFKQYRLDYVRRHFAIIANGLIIIFLLAVIITKRNRLRSIVVDIKNALLRMSGKGV